MLRNSSNTDPECSWPGPGLKDYIAMKEVQELCGNCRAKKLARTIAWDGELRGVAREDRRHSVQDDEWGWGLNRRRNCDLPVNEEEDMRQLEKRLDEAAPEGGWNHGLPVYHEEEVMEDELEEGEIREPSCDIPVQSVESDIDSGYGVSDKPGPPDSEDYFSRDSSNTQVADEDGQSEWPFPPNSPPYLPEYNEDFEVSHPLRVARCSFSPFTPEYEGDVNVSDGVVHVAGYSDSPVWHANSLPYGELGSPEYVPNSPIYNRELSSPTDELKSPRYPNLYSTTYEANSSISREGIRIYRGMGSPRY
jgi:hypothetical protein